MEQASEQKWTNKEDRNSECERDQQWNYQCRASDLKRLFLWCLWDILRWILIGSWISVLHRGLIYRDSRIDRARCNICGECHQACAEDKHIPEKQHAAQEWQAKELILVEAWVECLFIDVDVVIWPPDSDGC